MSEKDRVKFRRMLRIFKRHEQSSRPPSRGSVVEGPSLVQTEGQSLVQKEAHDSRPPTSGTKEAELLEQQPTSLSKSQALWNAAYDSLLENEDTAKLVRSYVQTLTTVLETKLPEAEVSVCLNDRIKRQDFMRQLVEEGQARLSTMSSITNGISDVAKFIVSVKGLVDAAIQNIPQAALPWAGVCIGLQILVNPANATKSNLAGIAHVTSRMKWYCALTEYILKEDYVNESGSVQPQLEEEILSLYKALLLYQMKSICSYYRNRDYEFLRNLANLNEWDGDLKAVKAAENVLTNDLDQYIKVQGDNMLRKFLQNAKEMNESLGDLRQTLQDFVVLQKSNLDEKNKQCLRDLFVVDPQDDMKKIERNKDTLLRQANEWIFRMEEYQAFTDWSNTGSEAPPCRLLWIKGHAGTGKTMLLMGIIRELLSQPAAFAPQISHFFCQGTVKALNTSTTTLRCLLWMLLVQQPHLVSHLKSKHDNAGASLFEGDSAFVSLNDVFESMLRDPNFSPVYLVVDALDECEQGLGDLKRLIFTSLGICEKVKWLVSSRPTVDLKSPETEGSLVELDSQKLQNPVNAFIDYKISELRTRPGYSEEILEQLKGEVSEKAENTFLWVALVFKELDKEDGNQIVVDGMYALDIVRKTPSGLSKLYAYMMGKIEKGLGNDPEYCRKVLAAATLAFRPLTLSEIMVLAQLPNNIPATIVRKCGSFLTIQDEAVYLIHQSAKDYLHEHYEADLRHNISQGHEDIAKYSLRAMSLYLRQNMYNLDYGFKPENVRTPQPDPLVSIRYSCVFWVDHLAETNRKGLEPWRGLADNGEVLTFLRDKLLYWLEGLSLLNSLSKGADSIKKLLYIAQESNLNSQLARFLKDADKFIRSHGSIIERAPLQVYASALVFSPLTSEVKVTQWKHRVPLIKMVEGGETHWGACRQTLEDGYDVRSVAFSPNGQILASLSYYRIQLWEVSTGTHKRTIEGHSKRITSMSFSPDSKMLGSASADHTVQLWEVSTGSHKLTLEGHSEEVTGVAFSPGGKTLASWSLGKVIFWDVALGSCQQTIEDYGSVIDSVTFSPDGRILASVSNDDNIQLWDKSKGEHQQTLQASGQVFSVVFSSDGSILAASSSSSPFKGIIQLWDTSSWRQLKSIEGHATNSSPIALSPDGKMLAFESSDDSVLLWDIATESIGATFAGHKKSINDIEFSSDGMTLASGSSDGTIKLWDVGSDSQRLVEEPSDQRPITSVAFSPNGETLVLASRNDFQVWDTATWSCQQTISPKFVRDPEDLGITVNFSPNGNILAVMSPYEVQLWDTTTWARRRRQEGARPFGSRGDELVVAFSPDDKTLATASHDENVQCWLWDVATGSTLWTLSGHRWIRCVAFSPDGKTLASSSCGHWDWDGIFVDIWDAATGNHQQTLSTMGIGWSPSPLLAFSLNGKTLACTVSEGDIRLWHATTGSHPPKFEASQSSDHILEVPPSSQAPKFWYGPNPNTVTRMAFSPDGTFIWVDCRVIRLPLTSASLEKRSDENPPQTFVHFDDREEWICFNDKNILWLPNDYRPWRSRKTHFQGKITWGTQAGRRIYLQMAHEDIMPLRSE